MLLAIDVGNTNITLGIFKPREPAKTLRSRISSSLKPVPARPVLAASWRLATMAGATADEYGTKILDLLHYEALERSSIKSIAIASVVPSLTAVFDELSQKYFRLKPLIVGENAASPIANLYDNPKEVGADRIANAAAAYARFGGPAIVVDFGTATTFDCITRKGEYAGGLIVPGPNLASESLSLHTAKLPKVSLAKPARLIGKNTVESIQSGLFYGYLELIDGLIDRIKGELGGGSRVIATGGLASLVAGSSRHIKRDKVIPELTLEGIYIFYEKNIK